MNRKLKALGLAFVAVFAMMAVSATAASASGETFHSEAEHTIITGAQPVAEDDVFTVKAGTVKCTSATYTGTTAAAEGKTVASIEVSPAYSGCTAFGFVSTTIDVPAGCKYLFKGDTTGKELQIKCGAGESITVTAFNCHVKVGSQEAEGIVYDNGGSGTSRDVTATANISGLTYTQESKSFPGCSNGTFTDGKYVGSGTVKGTNTTGESVGVWWE